VLIERKGATTIHVTSRNKKSQEYLIEFSAMESYPSGDQAYQDSSTNPYSLDLWTSQQ